MGQKIKPKQCSSQPCLRNFVRIVYILTTPGCSKSQDWKKFNPFQGSESCHIPSREYMYRAVLESLLISGRSQRQKGDSGLE